MPPISHDAPTLPARADVRSKSDSTDAPSVTKGDKGSSSTQSLAITVNGVRYEISQQWAKNHPGGKVIYEFDNKDATDVFMAFHSQHAHNLLKNFRKLPSQPEAPIDAETRDFRALRERIIREGWLEASAGYYVWKTLSCVLMFALVTAICLSFPGQLWAIGLAALILGSAMSQCGWLAHDYLHHQVFADRRWNNILGLFVGGVLQGFSPTWWKDKHNTHHAVCNIHGHDPDISTVPIIAWSDMDAPLVKKIPAAWQIWLRNQVFLLPFILSFAQFSWRLQSFLTAYSSDSRQPIGERISVTLHYFGLAFLTYAVSTRWTDAVLFIVLQEVFGSYGKAVPFVLNHGGCPVVDADTPMSFLRLQVTTSRDVNPGLFMDWFMGGLNYQIEHHLFPTMPRHNLAKLKPIVRELSRKHKIPYVSVGFFTGFSQLFKALSEVAAAL